MRLFALALVSALAVCASASGAPAVDNYRYRINAHDRALARQAMLVKADLPTTVTWTGGAQKPDETPDAFVCKNYAKPKESDLTVTGDAESTFSHQGALIDSQAQVFQTQAMVATDWRRSRIGTAGFASCLGQEAAHYLGKGLTVASVKYLSLPHLGDKSFAVRAALRVAGSANLLLVDEVGIARGRTELTLGTIGVQVSPTDGIVLESIDVQLARVLAKRGATIV